MIASRKHLAYDPFDLLPITVMSKKASSCQICGILQWVVAILLFIATIAALIGAWRAHFTEVGAIFGSTSGSLALIALGVNATLWLQLMKRCCPCNLER